MNEDEDNALELLLVNILYQRNDVNITSESVILIRDINYYTKKL